MVVETRVQMKHNLFGIRQNFIFGPRHLKIAGRQVDQDYTIAVLPILDIIFEY